MTISPGTAPRGLLAALAAELRADLSHRTPGVSVLRALRGARALGEASRTRRLLSLPPARAHMALLGETDPIFPLSHRHYLARGLTPRQRLDAALCHYGHEATAFDDAYLHAVYGPRGLPLWEREVAGVAYDIRLMAGNDLLTEGGLSLVLHVDGGRVCVLSFSIVPAEAANLRRAGTIPLVTRKQHTQERGYQRAMNAAFDQTSPAHLCMGALAGLALAQGHDRLLGLASRHHPASEQVPPETLSAAYEGFWSTFGGEAAPLGRLIDLPLRYASVEDMTSAHRRRALKRRRQVDLVREAAEATIRRHLLREPRRAGRSDLGPMAA